MGDGMIILPTIVGGLIYLLPSIIAVIRGHHRTGAIILLNIFLGWTAVGWVVALLWSLLAESTTEKVERQVKEQFAKLKK